MLKKFLLLLLIAHVCVAQSTTDMNSDRPGRTENPRSVDAGRIQWDSDLVSFVSSSQQSSNYGLAVSNLKFGLNAWSDIELMAETFFRDEADAQGNQQTRSGLGNISLRSKFTVLNRGSFGASAAIVPYVSLATFSSANEFNQSELGVVVPVLLPLASHFFVKMDTRLAVVRENSGDRRSRMAMSAEVGRMLYSHLEAYLGVSTQRKTSLDSSLRPNADLGVNYVVSSDLRIDSGLSWDILSQNRSMLSPFLGISARY